MTAGSSASPAGGSVGKAGAGSSGTNPTGGDAGVGTGTGGGAAGSSRGGTAGTVGATGGGGGTTSGSAGTTSGTGAGNEGGESGTLGSGGSAGGAGDICRLPVEVGPCEAEILRYAFDAKTGTCLLFTYGGCEGNANNFETIDECYETCGGSGEIDPTSCSRSSECAVIDRGCCPGCGQDGYSLVAVNMSQAGAYTEALACDVAACELCVGPEISAPRAWFGATCSAGRCVLFDTRESPATACDLDADCQLRMGAGCCEACGEDPANVIAYDRDGILLDQICGENPGNCPDCAAIYPPEVEAFCDAGRCAVLSTLAGD